jgi:hypothetical protein
VRPICAALRPMVGVRLGVRILIYGLRFGHWGEEVGCVTGS